MTKEKFIELLRKGLSPLPKEEREERLTFYSEMIDDRMEEGVGEEEAVALVGSVEEIARQILAESNIEPKAKSRRNFRAWEIVLLVLGSPLWIALLGAVFAVVLAVLAVLWSAIVSFWAAFASIAASAFGVLVGGVVFAATGNGIISVAMLGAAMVCAGLAVFAFFGCVAATKGIVFLSKWTVLGIIRFFKRKGEA
ncbi:MAG: DUF1700 domain-containing protein [Oscillospiraceae bacterium]|nr:DUF1700 domain-containing protein [Oscillospiraceae bacterium]